LKKQVGSITIKDVEFAFEKIKEIGYKACLQVAKMIPAKGLDKNLKKI